MFPDVSRTYPGSVREVPIGKGDYILGGARGMPFVSFDPKHRRRPLIAGEVYADLSDYPEEAAEMFSGREGDPVEWAVMWKELGMDAVCIDAGGDSALAASIAKSISDRTSLPVIVRGDAAVFDGVAGSVGGTRIVFMGEGPDGHISAVPSGADAGRDDRVVLIDTRDGLAAAVSEIRALRNGALDGTGSDSPIVCDVTSAWDRSLCPTGDILGWATWREAMSALAAMEAGADMIIMKGARAADMALVYAEELSEVPLL